MKALQLPKITIIIVTFNNERTIETCLKAIRAQQYPKNRIEYLNIDGGSTDKTVSIVRRYGFTSIKSPIVGNAEAQRGVGLKLAKNNLIVSLDADNYLPQDLWLQQMVKPFIDDPKVVHANTIHYTYRKTDTLFNRYCALFGVNDPIVYYVGKPDRLEQYKKTWSKGTRIHETEGYYSVEFDMDSLPTVGCNGVVYRRDLLLKYAQSDPKHFLHIDIFADLIHKGFRRFAIVKNSVVHDTAVSLPALMKKRIAFLSGYYLKQTMKRRYLIFNPQDNSDRFKLFLFVIYTVTFVKPFFDSAIGYYYIRDVAWFMHPLVCWIYIFSYGTASIKKIISTKSHEK